MSDAPKSWKLQFDGTVTAGNLIMAFMMAIGVVIWGLRLEGLVSQNIYRIERNETQIESTGLAIERTVESAERRIGDHLVDLRDDVSELRAVLLGRTDAGRLP